MDRERDRVIASYRSESGTPVRQDRSLEVTFEVKIQIRIEVSGSRQTRRRDQGGKYGYLWVDVECEGGRTVHALAYRVPYDAPEGRPSAGYLSRIREAARQRGLPADYIAFLDSVEARQ